MINRVDHFSEMTDYKLSPWSSIRDCIVITLNSGAIRKILELTEDKLKPEPQVIINGGRCHYCSKLQGPQYDLVINPINCCPPCFTIQKRMFEYFKSRHALLKNMNRLDYVDDTKRKKGFAGECLSIRKKLQYCIGLLRSKFEILKDLRMIIIAICTEKICEESQITTYELIAGEENVDVFAW